MRALQSLLVATNLLLIAVVLWSLARPPAAEVIRARAIALVNERGETRAELHLGADGGGNLRLRNGAGEVRVKLAGTADGAVLLLLDAATEPGARLAADRGGSTLRLIDPDKRERVVAP